MKIAVFGATGQTGSILVEKLVSRSHSVKALVRSPEKAIMKSDSLTVLQGDVLDPAMVAKTIEGCDAVISVIGADTLKPVTLMTDGIRIIAGAMEKAKVKRIVSMGTAGILHEISGIAGVIVGFTLRNPIKDHRGAYDILANGSLDWTVIRPLSLTNAAATGKARIDRDGIPSGGKTVSRADVADFMIKVLEGGEYIRASPAIAD